MVEKTLTIKQLKNGYTATLCSYEENKGGMSGFHEETFIIKELPEEIKKMFDSKYAGKVETPDQKKKMDFSKAEAEAMEAPEKEEEEEE